MTCMVRAINCRILNHSTKGEETSTQHSPDLCNQNCKDRLGRQRDTLAALHAHTHTVAWDADFTKVFLEIRLWR
jgi:hypothetical protein